MTQIRPKSLCWLARVERRALPRAIGTGLLCVSFGSGAAASELSWSGPAECQQNEQLAFQVERALGAPLASAGDLHLQVQVERLQPDARALLRIDLDSSASQAAAAKERLLVAPDCAKLVDTLAVAITLAIEAELPTPEAASPTPEAAPHAPAPGNGSAPTPALPGVRDVAAAGARESAPAPIRLSVSAHAIGDAGSLPNPALGVAVGVQLGAARWQLQLLGSLWLEQHALLQPSSVAGAAADVQLATLALLGCTNPAGSSADPWSFALCAGWEMGRLRGEGAGVNRPRIARALWLAPSLQASLSWQVPGTRLRLVALGGAALPLDRREVVLERLGSVYQPASLAARLSLGVDVAFE